MNKHSLGKIGEDLACKYLLKKGYRIINRNFHSRWGEIDIVAQKNQTLYFIEVKTRWSSKFGDPETAVTKFKLNSIIKTAHFYKILYPHTAEKKQIDVVAIKLTSSGQLLDLKHFENVSL